MKVAKVIPIFKTGDIHDDRFLYCHSYQKILKSCLKKSLSQYINANDYFLKGEYGFRTNHSTGLALGQMI